MQLLLIFVVVVVDFVVDDLVVVDLVVYPFWIAQNPSLLLHNEEATGRGFWPCYDVLSRL